jgi:uncharacterized membrane protein
MDTHYSAPSSWLDRPLTFLTQWNIEKVLAVVILLLTVISRFYMLGERVMSHDEVNHVVPSWELYQGSGYRHDPVTHGPFQFHIVALSYFMFGDSDTSARIPAALFSIAAVAVVLFGFRRYLGRTGALIAGLMFMISPFLLFYGRYTRNEALLSYTRSLPCLQSCVISTAAIHYRCICWRSSPSFNLSPKKQLIFIPRSCCFLPASFS